MASFTFSQALVLWKGEILPTVLSELASMLLRHGDLDEETLAHVTLVLSWL